MAKQKKKAEAEKSIEKVTVQPKPVRKVTLEINTNKIDESIRQAVERVQYWYKQGIINKVRLKYKGKAILPDIPLSYFMLVQVATFFLTGVVRALAINLGAKVFFEVEMINDAEELLKKARDLYLDGELDEAVRLLEEVIRLDDRYSEAFLYLGIINKIRGDRSAASKHFLQAQKLDPHGKAGREAAKNLKKMLPQPNENPRSSNA
jgi:tetratricopeptide (TPR) repeat protein